MRIMTESEEQWLEERRKRISATELAELHRCKTASVWQRIKQEKITGERRDISHKEAVVWGVGREPILAEALQGVDSRLVYNEHPQTLFVMDDDPRICGTPDLYSEDEEVLGEIKTSNHTFDIGSYGLALPDQYYLQDQANLMVTGAEVLLHLAEIHQDFVPVSTDLIHVKPDLTLHRELRATAEEWFRYMGGETPEWLTEIDNLDDLGTLADLGEQYAEINARINKDKESLGQLKEQILAITGDTAKVELGAVTVTVSTSKPGRSVDTTKLKKLYPDIAAECSKPKAGSTRILVTNNL